MGLKWSGSISRLLERQGQRLDSGALCSSELTVKWPASHFVNILMRNQHAIENGPAVRALSVTSGSSRQGALSTSSGNRLVHVGDDGR
jgi:hypothetical protein